MPRPTRLAPEGHKVCSRCLVAKPFDQFSLRSGARLGIRSHCKQCIKFCRDANRDQINARAAELRLQNLEENRVKHLERVHRYRDRHRSEERDRSNIRQTTQEYRDRFRDAHSAHSKLRYHITRGNIIKPTACSKCGKEGKIEGSHDDYSKPLEVEWLCVTCHRRKDSAQPKTRKKGA